MVPLAPVVVSMHSQLRVGTSKPNDVPLLSFRWDSASGAAGLQVPLATTAVAAGPEFWSGRAAAESLRVPGFDCRLDAGEGLLAGTLHIAAADSRDIEALAERVYDDLHAALQSSACPHLLRTWIWFDGINEGAGDEERYRRFCIGRDRSMRQPGRFAGFPAATVIGTQTPGFWFAFLASTQAGHAVENPRQTSAWQYPRQYGPSSPGFVRAMRWRDCLVVSGTASIVDHRSMHVGDLRGQFEEILRNLDALQTAAGDGRWFAQALRCYVRHEADVATVAQWCRAQFGDVVTVLRGDVCRQDLLLEMEGLWRMQSDAPAVPGRSQPLSAQGTGAPQGR